MKRVVTSVCPKCHKWYRDEYIKKDIDNVKLTFKTLTGVQCPQCKRWLLGTIEKVLEKEDDK